MRGSSKNISVKKSIIKFTLTKQIHTHTQATLTNITHKHTHTHITKEAKTYKS